MSTLHNQLTKTALLPFREDPVTPKKEEGKCVLDTGIAEMVLVQVTNHSFPCTIKCDFQHNEWGQNSKLWQ